MKICLYYKLKNYLGTYITYQRTTYKFVLFPKGEVRCGYGYYFCFERSLMKDDIFFFILKWYRVKIKVYTLYLNIYLFKSRTIFFYINIIIYITFLKYKSTQMFFLCLRLLNVSYIFKMCISHIIWQRHYEYMVPAVKTTKVSTVRISSHSILCLDHNFFLYYKF